jgi:phosphate transport system permease protein
MKDRLFKIVLICSGLIVLLLVAGIIYTLIVQSLPAFRQVGFFHFIASPEWEAHEGQEKYGALSFICGTVFTAILALLISFPFSFSLSLFNSEYCKEKKITYWVVSLVNTCAGIPSIILGIWGYFTLRPLFISLNISAYGFGILTAALVLAIMIIPYAASLISFFIAKVPQDIKEGAYCLGATHTEVIGNISLPFAKKGIIAVYLLALGKALGETMIVTILIGNAGKIPSAITSSGNSITSIIVNHLGTAGGLELSALCALALLLFLFTAGVNSAARYLIRKTTA